MSWLVDYFNDQRLSCSASSNEGIFTKWKPYLVSLIALYEYISRDVLSAHELQLAEYDIEGKMIGIFFLPIFLSTFVCYI